MKSPFFSVIIPTYNRASFLSNAIGSVLAQTFFDWELLVIDDGSVDNTKEVVGKFSDSRITYIWQENQERSAARNNGISLSKGEFICFLDSDDLWRVNHLQLLYEKIKLVDSKRAIYFSGMTWNFPEQKRDVIFGSPEGGNRIEYVITNQIAPSTACVSSAILQKEKFNITLHINEDVELFARIVSEYELIQLQETTVDFMVHTANTKASEKNIINSQIEAMKVIFSNPSLKGKISPLFKSKTFRNLRHQLINHYSKTGEFKKMNREIIRFVIDYPFDFQNKSKMVLLFYHLPGGGVLQRIWGYVKAMR